MNTIKQTPTEQSQNIPEGWVKTTLGKFGRVVTGKTPSKNNPEDWGEKVDFITPSEIESSSKFIYDTPRKLSKFGFDRFSRMLLPAKSVIVTCIGSDMGKVVLNRNLALTNQQINSIIVNEKDSNDYVFYLLKNAYRVLRRNAEGSGSTMPILNKSSFEALSFLVPISIDEQKSIAAILTALDNKIELLQAQNQTLEETAQTIFKEWFGKYQIGDELPEGWRVGKLGDEFEILMGQSPNGESYNTEGKGMVFFQGRAEFSERFPKNRLYTTEPKRVAEKFDVLVCVRAPVGDINVASETCCIGRGLAAVKSKNKSYALYKLMYLKPEFDLFEGEGTVFGSINKESFNNIEVIIPSDSKVNDFENCISKLDYKIFLNHQQIQTLTQTRDALLPKLMSGEVRVNEF